jgi:hypothetical protein
MKKYNKNFLQEIYRINELLGTQLISEGVVDDIVRQLLKDPSSYLDKVARKNLENALFSASEAGRNLSITNIADDLWKLVGNSPELSKKIFDDILTTNPTLRTQFDVSISNPKWKDKTPTEIPEIVNNYIDDAFDGINVPEGYKNFLKKGLVDEITQSVKTILTKEQENLMKVLLKNNETFWDKIFLNGKKIAEQVKTDLNVLATTKFQKESDVVFLEKRVQENLKKLIDWRRSSYNNLVDEINAIDKGTTNKENSFRWVNLIESIKKEFGDWTLMDNIAKNKTTWDAIMDTIRDGIYQANKQFINTVLFVPRMIADSKFFTGKAVETYTQATVKASQKPESTQTLGKSFLNWLTVYTPRGLPREKNIKNFQDVYNIAGKWGMVGSYTIEVITRAYKTAAYIVAAQNLWEWLTAGTNRIDEFPVQRQCNEQFVSVIKQNDFSAEEAAKFLVTQFNPKSEPTLPCIVNLNMTDDKLTEFMAVALYRSKGTGLWAFLQRVLESTWIRIKDDPRLGGPPFLSLPTLFAQFGDKSIFAVIQENMPAIDTAEIRREGPIRTNGTPLPVIPDTEPGDLAKLKLVFPQTLGFEVGKNPINPLIYVVKDKNNPNIEHQFSSFNNKYYLWVNNKIVNNKTGKYEFDNGNIIIKNDNGQQIRKFTKN